jgi:immunoglobulin-like protein involved in spore germination
MIRRPAQNGIICILLAMVVLLPAACMVDMRGTGTVTPTPTRATAVPTAPPTSPPTPVSTRNTLAISEPLPDSIITDTVEVKGEGMAFENTIIVEVVANGATLGRSIVTTTAQSGEIGAFTTTVTVGPVSSDTEGLVTIYTTSARDGSIDQRASTPVTIKAHGQTTPITTGNRPNIRISPTRGRSGMGVTVVGSGFRAGGTVQIRLGTVDQGAAPTVYATTQAGEHGNIQASFIMPFEWPSGEPINVRQITIIASSPDFIDKAAAQFTFETPTPVP